MLGLKITVSWPSKTEGVGTWHPKLIWVRGFEHSTWNRTSWDATSLSTQLSGPSAEPRDPPPAGGGSGTQGVPRNGGRTTSKAGGRTRDITWTYISSYYSVRYYTRRGNIAAALEEAKGSQGMGVVSSNWFDVVFYYKSFTSLHPHVDRCSNPLPWDPLSSPLMYVSCLRSIRVSTEVTFGRGEP